MKQNIVLILIAAVFLFSCKKDKIEGNGPIKTESRDVKNFYSVVVSGSPKVFITQGNSFSVQVKAYGNLLPSLSTTVENGALNIGYKPNLNISNDNSEITITMSVLIGLTLNGSGSIDFKGQPIGSQNFAINASGSGPITMENGSASNLRIIINGSNNVKTFGYPAQASQVNITGSGNAEVNVVQTLNGTINGSGNIYYKGPVKSVTSNITGSGQIIKMD